MSSSGAHAPATRAPDPGTVPITPNGAHASATGEHELGAVTITRGDPPVPSDGPEVPGAPAGVADPTHVPARLDPAPDADTPVQLTARVPAATSQEATAFPPRSVPLVAARMIVPAISPRTLGHAAQMPKVSRVVAARVIAPMAALAPPAPTGAAGPSASNSSTGAPPAGHTAPARGTSTEMTVHSVSEALKPTPIQRDPAAGAANDAVSDAVWTSVPALPAPFPPHATSTSTHSPGRAMGARPVGPSARSVAAPVQRAFGLPSALPSAPRLPSAPSLPSVPDLSSLAPSMPTAPDLSSLGSRAPGIPSPDELRSRAAEAMPAAQDQIRSASDTLTKAGQALSPTAGAGSSPAADNVEQLVRKLYGPLVRRIKAELLLDRERRGIRIDGI